MMKRAFDLILSVIALAVLLIPALITALLVSLTSDGPVLYWSERVGLNNRIFRMPKFRTMKIDTSAMATHLMQNPDIFITSIGRFLRKSSLDEIPQLYSIVKGDMSFVGPRPALFNQYDLIELRTKKGIHKLMPGLTGWAQINGRDEVPIPIKVKYDEHYKNNQGLIFDLEILLRTLMKVLKKEGINH